MSTETSFDQDPGKRRLLIDDEYLTEVFEKVEERIKRIKNLRFKENPTIVKIIYKY